ncbi:hypothetical protein V8F06_005244 [Rhypophila decipiens]
MTAQDGEWNQVSRKRGRIRHVPAPTLREKDTATGAATAEPVAGVRPNPTPEFTLDQILSHHDVVRQEWDTSECWRVLSETLSQALSSPGRPPITRAICLGPGPFEPSNGSAAARRTAHMQTAAFCSIVDKIESVSKHKIKSIIQEPAFTSVDNEFCSEMGLEVVETPAAFSMIDENTLLYGIHIELPTYHEALCKLPGVFMGVGLSDWESLGDFDKTIKDLLGPFQEMDSKYDKFEFPNLDYIFFGTVIYWKKEEDGPKEVNDS